MTSADLCTHAGITYRQLDHWARQGYLGERAQRNTGSGYERHWTGTEATKVRRMALLVRAGVGPAAAAVLADQNQHSLTDGRLVLTVEFREAAS